MTHTESAPLVRTLTLAFPPPSVFQDRSPYSPRPPPAPNVLTLVGDSAAAPSAAVIAPSADDTAPFNDATTPFADATAPITDGAVLPCGSASGSGQRGLDGAARPKHAPRSGPRMADFSKGLLAWVPELFRGLAASPVVSNSCTDRVGMALVVSFPSKYTQLSNWLELALWHKQTRTLRLQQDDRRACTAVARLEVFIQCNVSKWLPGQRLSGFNGNKLPVWATLI